MKLSEAIRLGAMLRPQAFGDFVKRYPDSKSGLLVSATCALGAACEAAGISIDAFDSLTISQEMEMFPLHAKSVHFPCQCRGFLRLRAAVAHLNDHHRWTRERIADWVEEQERLLEAPQVEVPAEVAVA